MNRITYWLRKAKRYLMTTRTDCGTLDKMETSSSLHAVSWSASVTISISIRTITVTCTQIQRCTHVHPEILSAFSWFIGVSQSGPRNCIPPDQIPRHLHSKRQFQVNLVESVPTISCLPAAVLKEDLWVQLAQCPKLVHGPVSSHWDQHWAYKWGALFDTYARLFSFSHLVMPFYHKQTDTYLMAWFPGQPG